MTRTSYDRKFWTGSFIHNAQWTLFLAAICLLAGAVGDSHAAPLRFRWTVTAETVRLCERGRAVLTFQLTPKSLNGQYARADYVHPLYGPDGKVVTEDFPKDHLHHRGVFWAWHQLLLHGKPMADPWMCQDIQWKAPEAPGDWIETRASDQYAEMTVLWDWATPDPDRSGQLLRLVRETAKTTVWPSQEDQRILDFDLRLRALVEGVSIGGSDDVKGYGGFSPRIRLAEDVKFLGQTGEITPQRLSAVEGGAWVDVVETLDGVRKGVAIMVHPSHPGFPLKWILRPKGSMQNPQWPGRAPVELPTQTDVRLRYRLVLHTGELDHDALESLWRDFAERDGK